MTGANQFRHAAPRRAHLHSAAAAAARARHQPACHFARVPLCKFKCPPPARSGHFEACFAASIVSLPAARPFAADFGEVRDGNEFKSARQIQTLSWRNTLRAARLIGCSSLQDPSTSHRWRRLFMLRITFRRAAILYEERAKHSRGHIQWNIRCANIVVVVVVGRCFWRDLLHDCD